MATSTGTTTTTTTATSTSSPLELYYFKVFARVGPLLALEHSGISYEFKNPDDWMALKPTLAWKCLPALKNLPAEHTAALGDDNIGQEMAILHYIASVSPEKMKGASLSEELISQQLYGEAEDIYQSLGKIKNKILSAEEVVAFWKKEGQSATGHNRSFGVYTFLGLLEAFLSKCQGEGRAVSGHFTASGCTVGECKLWASLHCLFMIDPAVFDGFGDLKAFYERFKKEPATQNILAKELGQYFFKE